MALLLCGGIFEVVGGFWPLGIHTCFAGSLAVCLGGLGFIDFVVGLGLASDGDFC